MKSWYRIACRLAVALAAVWLLPAAALDGDVGGVTYSLANRASIGADWRVKPRNDALIGKLDVYGQQNLCSTDDCLSFTGSAAPNQRLLAARGAPLGIAADAGDLNFHRGDVVSAVAKLTSELRLTWGHFDFYGRTLAFIDAVNDGRNDRNSNVLYQASETPQPALAETQIGANVQLYNAVLTSRFDITDHHVEVGVGRQIVRWGESTFIPLNVLAEVNPPNANRLYAPGSEINEVFEPVGLGRISADLFENASAEAIYQFEWRPAQPAAAGSFFSDIDVPGGRNYLMTALGQVPDDPNGVHHIAGIPSLISSTTFRAQLMDRSYGRPPNGGQYGLRLNYFAESLNGGTEFSLYGMNYHSRLPYLSVIATNASCARNSNGFAEALVDCRGFSGSLNVTGAGLEPAPIDTLKPFLDYPKDIHLFGVSFNTPLFGWSLAGEYSYRPNLPVQVSITDVVYAGLQPSLPRNDIVIGLPGLLAITVPSSRRFVPDFLSVYRGVDVTAGQRIAGYERLGVGELDLTAIRLISASNPFGADQIQVIAEIGATHVVGMPNRQHIQFEGGVWQKDTHASAGADEGDPIRLNPTRQTRFFADDFAWGYRLYTRFEYNNVLPGIALNPSIFFSHDVQGIAVYPMQNFVEGRIQYAISCDAVYRALTGTVYYHGFEGSNNTLRDRDYVGVSVAYSF